MEESNEQREYKVVPGLALFREMDQWQNPEIKWKGKIPKGQSIVTEVSRSSLGYKTPADLTQGG